MKWQSPAENMIATAYRTQQTYSRLSSWWFWEIYQSTSIVILINRSDFSWLAQQKFSMKPSTKERYCLAGKRLCLISLSYSKTFVTKDKKNVCCHSSHDRNEKKIRAISTIKKKRETKNNARCCLATYDWQVFCVNRIFRWIS